MQTGGTVPLFPIDIDTMDVFRATQY